MVKSFVIDKIEIRESPIHGKGMFAKELIKKGEIVFTRLYNFYRWYPCCWMNCFRAFMIALDFMLVSIFFTKMA